jgi:hypothetical protein
MSILSIPRRRGAWEYHQVLWPRVAGALGWAGRGEGWGVTGGNLGGTLVAVGRDAAVVAPAREGESAAGRPRSGNESAV